jgi:alpha-L-fucosidase
MLSPRALLIAGLLATLCLPSLLRADDVPQDVLRQAAHVTPSPQQAAWQELEYICFAHFGMNTFTNREWGEGKEDPKDFNPTAFDARQWVQACKDAGMKLLIVTAKHHDGFCLWPSQYTEHSVKNSPWRDGKGDVVKEVSDACREAGLKFGFYLSPWDRHEATYGTDAYNDYFTNQLRELLTNYGPVTEVWFDGACGEGPNGKKQVYDFARYHKLIRELQPDAVIAISGPDVRWVGNEDGLARESEWSVMPQGVQQASEDLGNRKYLAGATGFTWHPAECDVSIRPGWFYHADQDGKVKPLSHLLDIYYRSVGRNAVLLLNIPPDRRGLFHENDVARLRELRATLDETFQTNLAAGKSATTETQAEGHAAAAAVDGNPDTYWTTPDGTTTGTIEINLGQAVTFDRAMLQEEIRQGQRVEQFKLEGFVDGAWKPIANATTIGYKRLLRFPEVTTDRVRLIIEQSRDCPTIRELGLFKASAKEKE